MFAFLLFIIFDISSTGSTAPISLFTYIIETSIVSSLILSFNTSRSTLPVLSTGSTVSSKPSSAKNVAGIYTAGCSIPDIIICFPSLFFAIAVPKSAILLDSVPPDVKIISLFLTFRVFAIVSAASFTYFSASTPFICFALLFA